MVRLNKIYTRTGDDGTTALGSGERRAKHDLRIEAYGTVDEANAAIGMARLHTAELGALDSILARIQNDFFDLGADLATPETDEPPEYTPLRVTESQVQRIEGEIDGLNSGLEPLRSFVLPGGSAAAANLHLARTIARRAERYMVALADTGEKVNPTALHYINRVSDLLFVAARCANENGRKDILWKPGEHR
ncbi:cob(I)yrinic acid a,c-diamide adenosyltransferase [Hoeflea poritis]|uniref:Corrinoid adenosyltransferase n=1 Tax=Hoeflea poritis TaxID=2993659 RepID=A0ABT4VM96_9HYPH|nr:cob(I)yrinic acid a,c-diamide adenosyltransferase [Hoeflea poritis]MDA4845821.1 cob(I)yrinic acid a,c-diamide adenosyltransferase [Hoeflea poritis]